MPIKPWRKGLFFFFIIFVLVCAGWDGVAEGSLVVKAASGPTRALSGEWCMSPGNYITASNITEAAQIKKADRLPCSRLDSVTCFRRCSDLP